MTQDTPVFALLGFLERKSWHPPRSITINKLAILAGALGLLWGAGAMAEPSSKSLTNPLSNTRAKPLPTHVCSPRMGDYNDRQAFVGFNDGSVQWCLSRNQCRRLEGLPESQSAIVAFSCEREQFVWLIRADGLVYRCGGAIGRKACEPVLLQ
ncbi:MAG: hypothetical protein H6935_03350 [Thiobacillus sp.]|nr:hypothetical protein [Thiobacillus sp.]